MCQPVQVTKPAPRPLALLAGGARPQDVARLRAALAERLQRRGVLDGAPGGALGRPPTDPPLLVPLSAREDPLRVHQALSQRLAEAPVFPQADLLLRTSGSTTGTGSLVAMSVRALAASARATHQRLAGPGTWVLALPAHHVAGLQVLVRSVLAQQEPRVVDTSDGFDPAALAAALEQALAQAGGRPVYTALVPTQLYDALQHPGARQALSRLGAVLVGGAAADRVLLERARAAQVPVVRTYGMSETGGGCVYEGQPLEGVRVRIESPEADGTGRVVLAGPVLAEGYAAVQAGSGTAFRHDAEGRRELVTSDRGRLVPGPGGEPCLQVLGRVDDLIVSGGVKVWPEAVEQVLLSLPGVAQACVVGVPHERWGSMVTGVVVPEPGAAADQGWCERLRQQARSQLPGAQAPKQVLVVERLPLRGPGKTDRRALAAWAAEQTRPPRLGARLR